MQASPVGALRGQILSELGPLIGQLKDAEDLERTATDIRASKVGAAISYERPIRALVKNMALEQNLPTTYVQYFDQLKAAVDVSRCSRYIQIAERFQKTYPHSILPELLHFNAPPITKERLKCKALMTGDRCLWLNKQAEELKKKKEATKILEETVKKTRLCELEACELWQESSDRKATDQSQVQTIISLFVGTLGGALIAGAASAALNPIAVASLTNIGNAAQTGACTGGSVVSSTVEIISGQPQILDIQNAKTLEFRSLSSRVVYAFQPNSSGPINRIKSTLTKQGSHTIGCVLVRTGKDWNHTYMLIFNLKGPEKGEFYIEAMDYWNLCTELWKKVESKELPHDECLDIFDQLEKGEINPGDGYACVPGIVDERLYFCAERLKQHCYSLLPDKQKKLRCIKKDIGDFVWVGDLSTDLPVEEKKKWRKSV